MVTWIWLDSFTIELYSEIWLDNTTDSKYDLQHILYSIELLKFPRIVGPWDLLKILRWVADDDMPLHSLKPPLWTRDWEPRRVVYWHWQWHWWAGPRHSTSGRKVHRVPSGKIWKTTSTGLWKLIPSPENHADKSLPLNLLLPKSYQNCMRWC